MEKSNTPNSIYPLIIFLGSVYALGSLGIDSMIPSLTQIAQDLHLTHPNLAQLIISFFGLGMGLGSLFGGGLSDHFGRKAIIITGGLLYTLGSVFALFSETLWLILLARIIQGVGASFTTVAAAARARDLHSGTTLAKIMNFAMTMFAAMPAIAPLLGQTIAELAGWRAIFALYAMVSLFIVAYVLLATTEIPVKKKASFSLIRIFDGAKSLLTVRKIRIAIITQTMSSAILFSALSTMQPIFDQSFNRSSAFPTYFALMALAIALAGILSGNVVHKFGSRNIVSFGFSMNMTIALTALIFSWEHETLSFKFPIFIIFATGIFFVQGLTSGNLSAIALEAAEKEVGIAASLFSSIPMLLAMPLSAIVSLSSDGTPLPLLFAVLLFSTIAMLCISSPYEE